MRNEKEEKGKGCEKNIWRKKKEENRRKTWNDRQHKAYWLIARLSAVAR